METLQEIGAWLTDPVNWSGSTGIPTRLLEHVWMSFISVAIAAAIALPAGLYVGHTGRLRMLVVTVANVGRAVPSFGILALSLPLAFDLGLGLGLWPTVIALVALAIPPILTNAYVAIENVDADTVEAARGMGMSERDVLAKIEIPLGAPLIVAGIRIAAVQVVATATLAAFVAGGGLGRFIVDGFAVRNFGRIGGGAVLVAALALLTEAFFSIVQRLATPGRVRPPRAASDPLPAGYLSGEV